MADTSPVEDFIRQLESSSIAIHVGNKRHGKTFKLPKALLQAKSEWFAKALKEDRFKEGATGIINLPDDSVAAFSAFIYYVYHDKLLFKATDLLDREDDDDWTREIKHGIDAWVLGDKYGLSGLQNCIMFRLCEVLIKLGDARDGDRGAMTNELLAECFTLTAPGSPLRKIAADFVVHQVETNKIDAYRFTALAALDGFLSELFEAQRLYHEKAGEDFPRYTKPGIFRDVLQSGRGHNSSGVDEYTAAFQPGWSCQDCLLYGGSPRCGACGEESSCECDAELSVRCSRCMFGP